MSYAHGCRCPKCLKERSLDSRRLAVRLVFGAFGLGILLAVLVELGKRI